MYLNETDLKQKFYKPAANMNSDEVSKYLQRANSFANGVIGGQLKDEYVDDNLKAAVATAFEILAEGETAQTDPVNGNITEVAPDSNYPNNRRQSDPLDLVKTMLVPYKLLFEAQNSGKTDKRISFL